MTLRQQDLQIEVPIASKPLRIGAGGLQPLGATLLWRHGGLFQQRQSQQKEHHAKSKVAQGPRSLFRRVALKADVVLETFRSGVVQRLGVDYESLRNENPRLIYCSLSGYGQDGPYRDYAGAISTSKAWAAS